MLKKIVGTVVGLAAAGALVLVPATASLTIRGGSAAVSWSA